MSKAIHLICGHDERGQPDNMRFDHQSRAFWSGNWNLSEDEARRLVDGWIYLHVTKVEPSYYGGLVREFERVTITGVARKDRIRFRFEPSSVAKGLRWRGQDHARAWTGGLVDLAQDHELKKTET